MLKENLELYFSNKRRHRGLKIATLIMFIFLIIEKLISGISVKAASSGLNFYFALDEIDIICILVYAATVCLMLFRAPYKYLLLPDAILLLVKLYIAFSGISYLLSTGKHTIIGELNAYEKVAEALLFSGFLIVLFFGKLSHKENTFTKNYALFCILALILCFPATVFFEVLKIFQEIDMDYNYFVIFFNFLKRLIGEIFLNIPYMLLCLTLGFTKHKNTW